jgi:Transcriptional regulator, AbiEi antitoxin/Protein of unknown function (DUF559)
VEREIAALAESQHGVVAARQLEALSLSASGVRKRAARGYLHRVHRGVYAVGRPGLTVNGRRMAAVLAYPPGTVLSHRSAAGLWALRPDNRPRVEVSVPRRAARPKDGIQQHLAASLTADDITRVQGIPCTTVARTLVDLGDVASRRVIEYAVEQAELLHLFDLRAIEQALGRTGPTHGRSLLYSVLEDLTVGSTLTESELEEAFLAISRTVGLRDPEVNVWMTLPDGTAIRIDFLWRKERLAVETDGGPYHRTRQSRERDARRDQLLRLAGFEPVRFTDRQVAIEPDWVGQTLCALIARRQPLASRADDDGSGRARPQAA